MNDLLLTQALDLLAEAEISYTANRHSYDPEIIAEIRSISDQISNLYDKLEQSYVIIETQKLIGYKDVRSNVGVRNAEEKQTVKELFESLDFGEFICPGGPLKNCIPYNKLKSIFINNPDITIEEAMKRINN